MKGSELFSEFRLLPEEDQDDFLRLLGILLDLHVPDGKFVLVSVEDYARMTHLEGAA